MTQADDNAAGAQGDDANNNNDDLQDRVIDAGGLSLDDAHDKVLHDFDAEADQQALEDAAAGGDAEAQAKLDKQKADAEADAAAAAGDGGDDDGAGDDDDVNKPKPGASGDGAGGDAEADKDATAKAGEGTADYTPGSAAIPKAEELTPPVAPVVDSDIEKPGNYKVEFTDVDGKKYYVTSVAQLPEDFEPKSQRDYGMSIESLSEERSKFAADQSKYESEKSEFDNKSTVRTLQSNWHKEIETMTTSKALPEKKEERDKVVEGVFKLMNDELDNGNAIDSFAIAHELYMARTGRAEAEAAAAAKDKAEKEERKKKGGKVMGGGARSGAGSGSGGRSSNDGTGGRVLEAPAPGTSLDDIHNKIMHR